jgi:hypothetical protein
MQITIGKNGARTRLTKTELGKLKAARDLAALIARHAPAGVTPFAAAAEQQLSELIEFLREEPEPQRANVPSEGSRSGSAI